jgi:hypothetical protein
MKRLQQMSDHELTQEFLDRQKAYQQCRMGYAMRRYDEATEEIARRPNLKHLLETPRKSEGP